MSLRQMFEILDTLPMHTTSMGFSHRRGLAPATLSSTSCTCSRIQNQALDIGTAVKCACASRIARPTHALQKARAALNSRHYVRLVGKLPKPLATYLKKSEPAEEPPPEELDEWVDVPDAAQVAHSAAKQPPPREALNEHVLILRPSNERPRDNTPARTFDSFVAVSGSCSPVSMGFSSASEYEWDISESEGDEDDEYDSGETSEEGSEGDLDESLEALATSHFPPPYVICVSTSLILASFALAMVCFYMIVADILRILVFEPIARVTGAV